MDPVGVTLGAVSLATALSGTLVSVVECFEYMQLARRFGKDFDKSQARLVVLKLQITRLGVSIGALQDPDTGRYRTVTADEATAAAAKELLEAIQYDANEVERRAQKYRGEPLSVTVTELDSAAPDSDGNDKDATTTTALVSQTDTIVAKRLRGVSWTRKTKWALYEKNRFDRLLGDVAQNLGELEKLFEDKSVTQVAESQRELCRAEVGQVRDGQPEAVMELLGDVCQANGDTLLEQAVRDDIAARGACHIYARNEFSEDAKIEQGDRIAQGYTGQAPVGRRGHNYGVTIAKGRAAVRQGDTYGSG